MLWFKKKRAIIEHQQDVAQHTAIEIIAHKTAKQEAVNEAKDVNKQLKKLLEANGFTIKIYLAAGGRVPKVRKGIN